jgi:hypothetical protein
MAMAGKLSGRESWVVDRESINAGRRIQFLAARVFSDRSQALSFLLFWRGETGHRLIGR